MAEQVVIQIWNGLIDAVIKSNPDTKVIIKIHNDLDTDEELIGAGAEKDKAGVSWVTREY